MSENKRREYQECQCCRCSHGNCDVVEHGALRRLAPRAAAQGGFKPPCHVCSARAFSSITLCFMDLMPAETIERGLSVCD